MTIWTSKAYFINFPGMAKGYKLTAHLDFALQSNTNNTK